MSNFYECKTHYIKTLDNGTEKPVNEPYMVDAMSVTEAEARVIEELSPYISTGGVTVVSVTKSKISEAELNDEADKFFRAKVSMVTIDEKTAAEKRTPLHILIRANSFHEAYLAIDKFMKGTVVDWEIDSLMLTPIVDYYPKKEDE